jgi:hypothetical protein
MRDLNLAIIFSPYAMKQWKVGQEKRRLAGVELRLSGVLVGQTSSLPLNLVKVLLARLPKIQVAAV